MSLFTEYEKFKAARESLAVGSKWVVVESTRDIWGSNTPGDLVYIRSINSNIVWFSYVDSRRNLHNISINTFKRTFKPVL